MRIEKSSTYLSCLWSAVALILIFNALALPAYSKTRRSVHRPDPTLSRLVNSPTDNYIAGMEYAEFWQNRRMPLKVYFHPTAEVEGFDSGYLASFKWACQSWSDATEGMVKFECTDSEADADIDVRWSGDTKAWPGSMKGHELGECCPRFNDFEGIDHASIYLLTKIYGKKLGMKCMRWTALHELGHALGLGHSERATDIMTRMVTTQDVTDNGDKVLEAKSLNVSLSKRDVTSMRVVYSAKKKLDDIRQKRLDKTSACVELCNAAADQIRIGDSGQAIIFLREALNIDESFKTAKQNLMVAYYNCAAELYNNNHFSEALPVLKDALRLSREVGTLPEQRQMLALERNLNLAKGDSSITVRPPSNSSQSTYSSRAK